MKKIFTLAVVLFAVTAAFAAEPPRPNYGKVSINSKSNEYIQVVIDGKRYNMDRNDHMLQNLRPGRHNIQIYKYRQIGFRTKPQMIYNSTVNVKAWELIDININRNERVSVSSRIDPADRYGRDGRNDRGPRNGRF